MIVAGLDPEEQLPVQWESKNGQDSDDERRLSRGSKSAGESAATSPRMTPGSAGSGRKSR